MCQCPHRDDGELHLFIDVLSGELDITEVLFNVKRKLAVLARLNDAFAILQTDDNTLQGEHSHYEMLQEEKLLHGWCFLSADLLSDLLSVTEGGRDLGSDVGGASLLSDNVSQQVDEHLVVLQKRHCAVLSLKWQAGPQGPNAHVNLTWVLALPRLQQARTSQRQEVWGATVRIKVRTDLRLCDWLCDHRFIDVCVHVLRSTRRHLHISRYQTVLLPGTMLENRASPLKAASLFFGHGAGHIFNILCDRMRNVTFINPIHTKQIQTDQILWWYEPDASAELVSRRSFVSVWNSKTCVHIRFVPLQQSWPPSLSLDSCDIWATSSHFFFYSWIQHISCSRNIQQNQN